MFIPRNRTSKRSLKMAHQKNVQFVSWFPLVFGFSETWNLETYKITNLELIYTIYNIVRKYYYYYV